jgi:hypothetical protein
MTTGGIAAMKNLIVNSPEYGIHNTNNKKDIYEDPEQRIEAVSKAQFMKNVVSY